MTFVHPNWLLLLVLPLAFGLLDGPTPRRWIANAVRSRVTPQATSCWRCSCAALNSCRRYFWRLRLC